MRIGFIGGTGKEGKGLALRWAKAGHDVRIGSRDPERARARAEELSGLAAAKVEGGDNAWACENAEVVLLCVPYSGHGETLRAMKGALEGRILIDITVPLKPPAVDQVNLPPGQSAAMEAQEILGRGVKVVAALHHVSATLLADPSRTIECDVLVCADDEDAKKTVLGLVTDLGLRGLDAGVLRNAIALESLTPVLLHLNKRHKGSVAGIRFSGVPT